MKSVMIFPSILSAAAAAAAAAASTPNFPVRGCYSSLSTGFLPQSPNSISNGDTHERCANFCLRHGRGVAALDSLGCICGTLFPNDVWKINDSNCNFTCPGDTTQICGARHAKTVLDTGLGAGVNAETEEVYMDALSTLVVSSIATSTASGSQTATPSKSSGSASATTSSSQPAVVSETATGGAVSLAQAYQHAMMAAALFFVHAVCS